MNRPYRHGVTGVFVNDTGLVLACRRRDFPTGLQLPQGGVEKGETTIAALRREMQEELGTDAFVIVKATDSAVCYDFPSDLGVPIAQKFRGQCHYWFQLRFHSDGKPDLSRSDHEFSAYDWTTCETLLQQTIAWKISAYRTGLQLLGLLAA